MNQITRTTFFFFLIIMALCFLLSSADRIAAACYNMRAVHLLFVLVLVLSVVYAIRTTILTWITLMVLLAFAGNRRRVLVKKGRKITSDVAMSSAKIVIKDKSLVAFGCAAIVSLIAIALL
ncbi:uncharacterized protein LOC127253026 [Andrographis paniculata]|uniref:uncharacterized protein LOC127253026 n=1 Tax=Andrographis paniculata TaxID=175694 RepID=UPI0021E6F60A|nr:uncharacterized protein LOC127253026 [Andrographis paniculata]